MVPIEPGMRTNQEDDIRQKNISRGMLALECNRSIGLLDLCSLSADEKLRFITHVLLITISIAMMNGLGFAQATAASPEATESSSTMAHDESNGNQSTAIGRSSDQVSASPCRMLLRDPFPQSSATIGSVGYTPLTARCKLNLFLKQTYSPYTFVAAGFQATWAQAMGQWPHYGGGMQGWGKRFGATLADTESRRFIQTYALSTVLHQDPRYFSSGKRAFIARVWYSTTRVVVTKNDNGDNTFNSSEFLGALLSSALQNGYYPTDNRTFGDTMNRFGGALGSDAITDLLREFTPDMKRLFRKHAPKKIRKIEEKLPIPPEDKP